MHHARKKTAPRTMTTSSKRLKSGPDVRSNEGETVLWSDINCHLISDIFSHLFTIQQLKYRRVSSAWNSLLLDHLARSAVVSLRYPDLKYWKAIMRPPVRETRLGMRSRNVNIVTDRTRRLIIDFANTDCQSATFVRDAFGLIEKDKEPLADVGRYHPQISQVVLNRILKTYTLPFDWELGDFLSELGCQSLSFAYPTVVVTFCDFALRTGKLPCWMFTHAEWTVIESWKMSWPKTTLKFEAANFVALVRERFLEYWPYPPDQLTWLSSCLNLLPAEDPLFDFLSQEEENADLDFTPPTFLTLGGSAQSRYVLAFVARYMVTFRRHLNLPPPPHPLLWND